MGTLFVVMVLELEQKVLHPVLWRIVQVVCCLGVPGNDGN